MSYDFWSPVQLSLTIAAVSLIIVFSTAVIIARKMYRANFRGKLLVETLLLLPLVLPPTVVGFLLIVLFGNSGLIGGFFDTWFSESIMFTWWAAVISSTVVAFPLMYQSCKAGFSDVDKQIEDAAKVDGAGEWQVFFRITLPLSTRALISGSILAYARALGEFGATLMFAGNIPGKTQTIPTAIYVAFESGQYELVWLWVSIMIIISFIMLSASNRIR